MSEPIHWHEGLFLQPHHLQGLQRSIDEQVWSERRLRMPFPYGVVEARLSSDALENMLVQFDVLRVVMPSGLVVDAPETADLPALDIKRAFAAGSGSFSISLGVPLWYAGRANTIDAGAGDDWRTKRVFKVAEVKRWDENTGENPQPVQVRRINARLLLDVDDRTDLEVMPLIRIAHGTGEAVGLPRQDPSFVPACFMLTSSGALRELARDLSNQVEASRKELVVQLTRAGFSVDTMRGVQFEQMLRLRTLNRFSARLPSLVGTPGVTPFDMYMDLRELLAELAALRPERDLFEAPKYDHDNPMVSFADLSSKIRQLLRGAVGPSFLKEPFRREEDYLVADLKDEYLKRANEYFLGVKSKEDPRAVAALVEDSDKFKLMAKSMIRRQVWGVKLAEERHPPLELPAQTGLSYFRLMRAESTRMWEKAAEEKALAARWLGSENTDFELTLYMTAPAGGPG
ncbi:MAG: type VI secretion system baseplate subunit TssK [Phycisphaerae bacterium]|nr:type VI secretion system baseplate subunit TssK [Phycisphaerae bacterium]